MLHIAVDVGSKLKLYFQGLIIVAHPLRADAKDCHLLGVN